MQQIVAENRVAMYAGLGESEMRINVGPWRTTALRAEHRTDTARGDTKQRK
jgi:hypothetical protein